MALPILTIIGNVQKIETRQTQSGKNITTVNVSAGEKNKNNEFDNLYIKADFWEKQSDFVSQYFKEGDAIVVTGKLITTNYTKQDGTKVYETKFHFPQASFVPKSREAQPSQPQQGYQVQHEDRNGNPIQPAPSHQGTIPSINIEEDSIPFAPLKVV